MPHRDGSFTKNIIVPVALFGQWIAFGSLCAFMAPKRKLLWSFCLSIIGLPLMAAIWVVSLWPPRIVGFFWGAFWMTFPQGYLFTLPLTILGASVSTYLIKRANKQLSGAQPKKVG